MRSNIIIFNTSNTEQKVAPYRLITNIEETFTYLLGLDLNSKDLKPISIRISKIYNVITLNEKYKFNKEEKDKLNDIILHRVEFASSEIVKVLVEITKGGLRMLEYKLHNQPSIKKISENIIEVSSSLSNFINYFIPFGKEIKILNNDILNDKFYNFYKNALLNFNK